MPPELVNVVASVHKNIATMCYRLWIRQPYTSSRGCPISYFLCSRSFYARSFCVGQREDFGNDEHFRRGYLNSTQKAHNSSDLNSGEASEGQANQVLTASECFEPVVLGFRVFRYNCINKRSFSKPYDVTI